MALSQSDSRQAENADIILAGLPARERTHLSCIHSLHSKKLRDWCEQLNVLNIDVAIPQMVNLYRELAEVDLNAEDVFQLYLIAKPATDRIFDGVKAVYQQKKLQMTTQSKRAMEYAHSLDRAIILMFRSLLAEMNTYTNDERQKHFTALLGSSFYVYMANIFLRLNEFCLDIPTGFWRECHGVYWYLKKRGCNSILIDQVNYPDFPDKVSPKRLYLGLVLYSIIEPCRYDRALQKDLMKAMQVFGSMADLKESPAPNTLFSIVLNDDISHVPTRALTLVELPDQVLHLNLAPVVSFLQNPLSDPAAVTKSERVERCFDEFYSLFTVERYRKQARRELDIQVKGYFGLLHVFNQLVQEASADLDSDEEIHYDAPVQANIRSESLRMRDESDGGFCLETTEKNRLAYDSGDLVWLSSVQLEYLCIIRWTKMLVSGHYLIGLEKLTNQVQAVEFTVIDDQQTGDIEKALLFEQQGRTVLLSRVMATQGQELNVQLGDKQVSYTVEEVHWLVSGYVQKILEPLR